MRRRLMCRPLRGDGTETLYHSEMRPIPGEVQGKSLVLGQPQPANGRQTHQEEEDARSHHHREHQQTFRAIVVKPGIHKVSPKPSKTHHSVPYNTEQEHGPSTYPIPTVNCRGKDQPGENTERPSFLGVPRPVPAPCCLGPNHGKANPHSGQNRGQAAENEADPLERFQAALGEVGEATLAYETNSNRAQQESATISK